MQYSGDYPISGNTEGSSKAYNWVKVKFIPNENSKKNWEEGNEKEGWVPRIYIREDIKRTIMMNRYNNILISIDRVNEKTTANIPGNACDSWYSFATPDKKSTDVCPQTNNRWHIQVGPAVLDWEYPMSGSIGQDEEFNGFNKYVDVYLSLKIPVNNKNQNRILKCVVTNMKAHTYCYYPYPEIDKDHVRYTDAAHFKSDFVTRAMVDLCPGVIDPGIVQTGIRYPNADNGSVVKEAAMDFSVIEFYGGPNTKFGFTLSDYLLEKIVVNDDTITPNLRGKKMGVTT